MAPMYLEDDEFLACEHGDDCFCSLAGDDWDEPTQEYLLAPVQYEEQWWDEFVSTLAPQLEG